MNPPATGALLNEAQARFISRRISIIAGSCSAAGIPSVVRACGCKVAPDRRSLTVFLALDHSAAVLADLRAGGAIAVVFSLPSTHETLQLKGSHAHLVALEAGDRDLMRAYAESFTAELESIGCTQRFATAIIAGAEAEAIGVRFTPTAAFEQTPGPSAGRALNLAGTPA